MIPQENAKQLIVMLEAEKARIDQALAGLKPLAGVSAPSATVVTGRKRGRPSKAEVAARLAAQGGSTPVAPATVRTAPVRLVSKRKKAWTRAKRAAAAERMKNWWASQKSNQPAQSQG